MRLDAFGLDSHADTLAAVVLGALLATVSGVIANQLEAHIRRRERERAAALLFGEVFSTLRIILEDASVSREVGEPYGRVTRRMLQAARREVDIYERNREALVDLRKPALRSDMHNLALRIAMPLDGLLDSFLAGGDLDDEARDRAFEFMMANVERIAALVTRLGKIAGHSFDNYNEIARFGVSPS
jgi:hypothetical protein